MRPIVYKTVAAVTIGCRLNQADTALIFDRLTKGGFAILPPESEEPIGLFIVNSCTVTANAAQKSCQTVRKLRKKHPDSCIVVTGCSTEIENSFWAEEPSVDIIIPNTEKKNILEHIHRFVDGEALSHDASDFDSYDLVFNEDAEALFPFKSRAFLKVQEGCNSFCSYCIVPYARGRERSRAWDEVLKDFSNFISKGYREIVLTGVNISAYEDGGRKLHDLVKELATQEGDFRIRLSSTEPHHENHKLLDLMEQYPKICRFLHLPLQHGTDTILKRMNRKYTIKEFSEFVNEAKRRIPNIHIGTDVIVGFPGETDELFNDMCDFISETKFSNVHIFTFSPREGTPAATFDNQVPAQIAKQRYNHLSDIKKEFSFEFVNSQLGKELQVLVEKENKDGSFEGWSDNYIRFKFNAENIMKNNFVYVYGQSIADDGKVISKFIR